MKFLSSEPSDSKKMNTFSTTSTKRMHRALACLGLFLLIFLPSLSKSEIVGLLESAGMSRSNPYYIVQQGQVEDSGSVCLLLSAACFFVL